LGSLAARFIFRPIEESGYFYFTQMVKRDKTISDQNSVSLLEHILTCLYYIFFKRINRDTFSDEDARERKRIDTTLFGRHVYWSDCSSIWSVLLDHIAVVIWWLEINFTFTRFIIKSTLSRRIVVGN